LPAQDLAVYGWALRGADFAVPQSIAATGTCACGSQGAARRLAQKGRVGQRDSKE
jgi:hypothetical protein